MGSKIYKRGKTWWAYWTDTQGDHRKSLGTSDRVVAAERLRRVELAATNPAAHSGITLAQAITAMFAGRPTMPVGTKHAYSKQARSLARIIGADTPLVDVTRERIVEFINTRRGESISKATIGKELGVLRLGMAEAIDRGLFDGDIAAIVPKIKSDSKPRHRWLEQWEVQGVINQLNPQRRLWFVVAVYTGMRLGELERFAWADIDWSRGAIRVRGTKTRGSHRILPLAGPLAEMLADAKPKMDKISNSTVLTHWCSLHRDLIAALRRAKLAHAGVGTLQDVAVERISPNDLRRTFCSWLCQGGTTEAVAARLLGHSSSSMVRTVYAHYAQHNYTDAVARLPALCTTGVRHNLESRALPALPAKRKTG